jgi:hypothetical protein
MHSRAGARFFRSYPGRFRAYEIAVSSLNLLRDLSPLIPLLDATSRHPSSGLAHSRIRDQEPQAL